MIIVRSPLRISLGGGGTDLKSYYKDNGGFVISAAINKYIYLTINKPFKKGIYLKYSNYESVDKISEINHPIIRESLKKVIPDVDQIEITSLADIPAGTGLGSSGSFTTALIRSLYAFRKQHINQEELAKLACQIEIDILKEPIGKQDQYIASYGGITQINIQKNGKVNTKYLNISNKIIYSLEDKLLLFFTGYSRSASNILKDQVSKSKNNNIEMLENLHFTKELGIKSQEAIENGDVELLGKYMNTHWEHKKNRTKGMSNDNIDSWYQIALKNGAVGGKLVGAGGGGFFLFVANNKDKLRSAMNNLGLKEVRFKFDFEGTKLMVTT